MALMEIGLSDSEIARRLGTPLGTIKGWRHRRGSVYHMRLAAAAPGWRPPHPRAYSYLLGVYLGDGCLDVRRSGAAKLILSLDSSYPLVLAETLAAIEDVFPNTRVTRGSAKGSRVAILRASHPALPFAFPQHGRGRKHLRKLWLSDWQRACTGAHPEALLRGLIHSDGCRTVNRFKTKLPSGRVAEYEYPRYFFSNLSADIRQIFCDHCDLLGIRWTQSNPRNISVSHRRSVALLDEFAGPKA
jgi:hypothetical protein